MSKRNITEELKQIHDMCSRIRNINESLSFAEDEDMYGDEEEMMPQGEEPMQGEQQPMQSQADVENQEIESQMMDENSPINTIREIALKGMVRLCKTPEDPEYEVLKKVFTMIDKANDKKAEGQQQ